MVHRHVLLVREVRLALSRILVSKAPHPIHELEDERLITRYNILACKAFASGEPRALQILPRQEPQPRPAASENGCYVVYAPDFSRVAPGHEPRAAEASADRAVAAAAAGGTIAIRVASQRGVSGTYVVFDTLTICASSQALTLSGVPQRRIAR